MTDALLELEQQLATSRLPQLPIYGWTETRQAVFGKPNLFILLFIGSAGFSADDRMSQADA